MHGYFAVGTITTIEDVFRKLWDNCEHLEDNIHVKPALQLEFLLNTSRNGWVQIILEFQHHYEKYTKINKNYLYCICLIILFIC